MSIEKEGPAMIARRISLPLVLVATAFALLLAVPAALAVKTPSLASSAQYKAFVEYVKKMDGRSSQPTSTETKNTFEAKLTAKKTAAAHKANALFKRASEEAKAEADETAKGQAEGVRAKEGKEVEAVRAEAGSKTSKVEASSAAKFEQIATGHKTRETALKTQIAELRGKKAKAAPGPPKEKIQERIEAKSAEIAANREDEKKKRSALTAATGKQEDKIKEELGNKEAVIGESAEETVKKIDNHWNKAYEEKKAALNKTRENRLGYLEQKLEEGRTAVAAMPSNG
jgi:hypothetical protein